MPIRLRLFILVCLCLLSLAVHGAKPETPWSEAIARDDAHAFRNVSFGMSRSEIEAAQGVRLRAADPLFLERYGPPGIARGRLTDWEQTGVSLGGAPALISYRLLDDALYQVLIEQQGPPALRAQDVAIRAALVAAFGAGTPAARQRDDELHAHDWRVPPREVRYWMLDDTTEPDASRIFIGIEVTDRSRVAVPR